MDGPAGDDVEPGMGVEEEPAAGTYGETGSDDGALGTLAGLPPGLE
jgi:hypothetical protein